MATHAYGIEQLYDDQAPDFVVDAVPSVLAWLPPGLKGRGPLPFSIDVSRDRKSGTVEETLLLSWDMDVLSQRDPGLGARVKRLRGGRAALMKVRGNDRHPGKVAALRADPEIAEAWLSLWCCTPRISTLVKVKP